MCKEKDRRSRNYIITEERKLEVPPRETTTVQKVFVAILTILILPKTTSVCILLEPCSP